MKQQLFLITIACCTIIGTVRPVDITKAARKDNKTEQRDHLRSLMKELYVPKTGISQWFGEGIQLHHKDDIVSFAVLGQRYAHEELNKHNQQLLYSAKKNHHYRFVIKTLDSGALINIQDERGRTALHHATLHGNLASIKGLLGRNADPTVCDKSDENAVHIAAGEVERLIPFIEAAFGKKLCIKK